MLFCENSYIGMIYKNTTLNWFSIVYALVENVNVQMDQAGVVFYCIEFRYLIYLVYFMLRRIVKKDERSFGLAFQSFCVNLLGESGYSCFISI